MPTSCSLSLLRDRRDPCALLRRNEPDELTISPMLATTAAVPQAKRFAELSALRISAPLIHRVGRFGDFHPHVTRDIDNAGAVMPGRMVPVSGGVTMEPSFITKNRFMPPSSSIQRCSAASRNTT